MTIFSYEAAELFGCLEQGREDILVLDVRNEKDFSRFRVESPKPFALSNISYYRFMEQEQESAAQVPKDRSVRIICAKEGSAKYVAEILEKHGWKDVGYMAGGIKSWGNMLVPKLVFQGQDYELHQFIRPGKASCSYGLICGKEMMLFDPSRNTEFYLQFAAQKGCRISKTFETHLQADYIAGSRSVAEQTGAAFHANSGDFASSKMPYLPLRDGGIHRFSSGGPEVTAIFTPGHTPGSTCYLIGGSHLLTGDTVFLSSVGRPDLGGQAEAWAAQLHRSLGRLQQLEPDIRVLPGHYMDWTEADARLIFTARLSEIIERNKAIYSLPGEADFIQFIKDNLRPQPEEYALIRRINAGLEQVDPDRAEELDLGKNECAATAYAKAKAGQTA